jgi:uncharacterized membrane protein YecN with MAPEG domain
MLAITAFYASLLAFLFIALSARVIAQRRAARVELGDGNDKDLMRRIRIHANFAEYVPFALLLMALAESLAPPRPLIHLAGLLLVAGRVMHAWGVTGGLPRLRFRVYGMMLTLGSIGISALTCLPLAAFLVAV